MNKVNETVVSTSTAGDKLFEAFMKAYQQKMRDAISENREPETDPELCAMTQVLVNAGMGDEAEDMRLDAIDKVRWPLAAAETIIYRGLVYFKAAVPGTQVNISSAVKNQNGDLLFTASVIIPNTGTAKIRADRV